MESGLCSDSCLPLTFPRRAAAGGKHAGGFGGGGRGGPVPPPPDSQDSHYTHLPVSTRGHLYFTLTTCSHGPRSRHGEAVSGSEP